MVGATWLAHRASGFFHRPNTTGLPRCKRGPTSNSWHMAGWLPARLHHLRPSRDAYLGTLKGVVRTPTRCTGPWILGNVRPESPYNGFFLREQSTKWWGPGKDRSIETPLTRPQSAGVISVLELPILLPYAVWSASDYCICKTAANLFSHQPNTTGFPTVNGGSTYKSWRHSLFSTFLSSKFCPGPCAVENAQK
jgi:hypothetical protein